MWSDECSAQQGRGKLIEQVFGYRSNKWKPSHVTTYKKGKDLRVMVQAAFQGFGNRTPLYIMDCDFKSKKNRFSANSYIEVLNAHAQYMSDNTCFMQNNASIHTTKKVKDWFREQKVWCMYRLASIQSRPQPYQKRVARNKVSGFEDVP